MEVQAPQEGVMWIAAMNETLLGLFVLSTLVLWFRGHYLISAIFLLLALFSKESAFVILLLIALLELKQRERKLFRAYALLLLPAGIFAAKCRR